MNEKHIHSWTLVEKPPTDPDGRLLIGSIPWICECGAVEKTGRLGPKETVRVPSDYLFNKGTEA